jgi:hypothetical protein
MRRCSKDRGGTRWFKSVENFFKKQACKKSGMESVTDRIVKKKIFSIYDSSKSVCVSVAYVFTKKIAMYIVSN